MNFLNQYSLERENYYDLARTYPPKKLFNLKNTTYCFLFIVNYKIVAKENNPFFFKTEKIDFSFKFNSLSYINKIEKKIFILCNVSELVFQNDAFFQKCHLLHNREILFNSKQKNVSIVSAGYSLYKWQNNNKYCGKCGSETKLTDNGNSLLCKKRNCSKKIFPLVYPTVIVNVIYKNKILLARNTDWNENLYSCLAGFCEQNESVEEAIQREVYEEVGLKLKKIKYCYSQYWPFSSNLMLGYQATALSDKIKINKNEIEKAMWCSSKQISNLLKKNKLILPRKEAIAYYLIKDWIKEN